MSERLTIMIIDELQNYLDNDNRPVMHDYNTFKSMTDSKVEDFEVIPNVDGIIFHTYETDIRKIYELYKVKHSMQILYSFSGSGFFKDAKDIII